MKKDNFFKQKNKLLDPYIIAEIGVNHECSISNAKKLIKQAKEGGAQAVKFQSYKADSLSSKNAKAYWDLKKEKSKSQFNLFKKYDKFNKNDYIKLYEYSKKIGIIFSSTPFDTFAVDYLNKLVSFFKIASADITNLPLIEHIASKKKPIILSTGASNVKEIETAVKLIKKKGVNDICLMHCILNYPTKKDNANLLMISHLKKKFPEIVIGYSDHTKPDKNMSCLTTAYLLGARVIEKHFTNNKKKKGNDHYHSMDKFDLKRFFKNINHLKKLLGNSSEKKPIKSELISRKNARRSIVATKFLKKGMKIRESDIICKRPGTGISPYLFKKIIGKKTARAIKEDQILKNSDIK